MDMSNERLINLTGAFVVAAADRLHEAASDAARRGAATPAALVALDQFLGGGSVGDLRSAVGLTHSGAVRLADRLEADGLVSRGRGRDGRSVALTLTRRGRRVAARVRRARADALAPLVAALPTEDREALERLLEQLLRSITLDRLEERRAGDQPAGGWLCRLCDLHACDRDDGRCPAANATTGTDTRNL